MAAVGTALTTIETWSLLAVQGALVIVHWYTYVPAVVNPVTVVVGDPGVVMAPPAGPLTLVQAPVPTVAVFAAMVMEPGEEQIA